MAMIANLQYGWTLFVNPIDAKYHWGRAAIQVAFSCLCVDGDVAGAGGGLVCRPLRAEARGVGRRRSCRYCVDDERRRELSDSLLYISAAIGGIGAGAVYGTCIGNALKWFSDLRGLATGLTAAGFGAGSALTVLPIQGMINADGYEAAFLYFGIGQGIVVCVISWFLRAPRQGEAVVANPVTLRPVGRQYTPIEMVRSPVFWVMYVMFVLVGVGGLMATAQLAPIAKDLKIDSVPVSLVGITLPALTFALSLDRILNGLTRPFFGWVSDNIGRENTMFIAFGLEAAGISLLGMVGESPLTFVIVSGLVFFAWGEIYSLFPSTCTDAYGTKYATTNAGLLYTAKGTAAAARAFWQCADHGDGELACGVHDRGDHEPGRGAFGAARAEAVADGARCAEQNPRRPRGGIFRLWELTARLQCVMPVSSATLTNPVFLLRG